MKVRNFKFCDLIEQIKKHEIKNIYLFCSIDSKLIEEVVETIKNEILSDEFKSLNYKSIDGNNLDNIDEIINSCETLPFMSDKRIVEIYNFKLISQGKSNKVTTIAKELKEYLKNMPESTILIMHYPLKTDREKPSKSFDYIANLKNVYASKLEKLKGLELSSSVKQMFFERNKKISISNLNYFCSLIDNNMNIIENEVEKLCSYTYDRDITKEDINLMLPQKKANDIFNLVDLLSKKDFNKACDILNELIYKGETEFRILSMMERQYRLLLIMKMYVREGKTKDEIISLLNLNPFVGENMIRQSRNFSEISLKKILDLCLTSEKILKTKSTNKKTELEMLIVNIILVTK